MGAGLGAAGLGATGLRGYWPPTPISVGLAIRWADVDSSGRSSGSFSRFHDQTAGGWGGKWTLGSVEAGNWGVERKGKCFPPKPRGLNARQRQKQGWDQTCMQQRCCISTRCEAIASRRPLIRNIKLGKCTVLYHVPWQLYRGNWGTGVPGQNSCLF